MPINTKIRLTKRVTIPYSRKLAASANIEKSNCIVGENLILDEGTQIRFDGFAAFATNSAYPDVKISVFPPEGKSGQIYVSLENFDGLTWEPVVEEKKDDKKSEKGPVRRYEVFLNGNKIEDRRIWHNCFDCGYEIGKDGLVLINPLKLTKSEILTGFIADRENDIGEALYSEDRSKTAYSIRVRTQYKFTTQIMMNGLLGANHLSTNHYLEIANKWSNDYVTIGEVFVNETNIIDMIKNWMKETHKQK